MVPARDLFPAKFKIGVLQYIRITADQKIQSILDLIRKSTSGWKTQIDPLNKVVNYGSFKVRFLYLLQATNHLICKT